jgi:hypothetical protein
VRVEVVSLLARLFIRGAATKMLNDPAPYSAGSRLSARITASIPPHHNLFNFLHSNVYGGCQGAIVLYLL